MKKGLMKKGHVKKSADERKCRSKKVLFSRSGSNRGKPAGVRPANGAIGAGGFFGLAPFLTWSRAWRKTLPIVAARPSQATLLK